jgi:hypothetical protein
VLAVLSCRGPVTRQIDDPPPPPPPTCGDGIIQDGEDCDASALGVGTCQTLGFDTGRLVCTAACRYDTALCVKRCGNGVLDLTEACDGTLGLEDCPSWGFNACTDACTVDARRCVATAFEAGPELELSKGGPAVIGDLAPRGPGDLVMAVPAFSRVELFPWSMTQGLEASTSRKLSFLRDPLEVELLDVGDDGITDLATVNADGGVDLLVYIGASYALRPLDAGCPGARFLPSNGAPGPALIATGCGGYAEVSERGYAFTQTPGAAAIAASPAGVFWADSAQLVHEPDGGTQALPVTPSALAAADLDADGDLDLIGVGPSGVLVLEATSQGYATRVTWPGSSLAELRALDLDQDGRPDVAWVDETTLVIRRNRGDFVFSEVRVPLGAGARRSLAFGDLDGDGDLDVAVTFSLGPDATRTRVILNKLR